MGAECAGLELDGAVFESEVETEPSETSGGVCGTRGEGVAALVPAGGFSLRFMCAIRA